MPSEDPPLRSEGPEDLFPLVYEELRHLAQRFLEGERRDHTLQPTALVHEAFLRLQQANPDASPWTSRSHFLHAAARAMRRILVDSARARRSGKRGGTQKKLSLDAVELLERGSIDLVVLDEALTSLQALDEQLSRIVELRFFGGLTIEETALALSVSTPTIERGWRIARLWLRRAIAGHLADE
ncbi:MAG: sigma-70 family RNA polymerase sigma factor [Planctomycetes bacterium]|nr:sigma-70 family RNA polymerase sigma factor [Planctomycetota bacterium]MCB9890931.1 sigma-70 family RNA polymerase sigma factor [Planctomycetota bacterium]